MAIRPITDTLRLLEGGAFLDVASEKLNDLVKRIDETGRAGKLTITLELKRARTGAINIIPTVVAKVPETKAEPSMLWVTAEGNLTVDNPAQQKLDLRTVEQAKGDIRNVETDRGELRTAT